MTENILDRKFAGKLSIEQAAYIALFVIATLLCTINLGVRPYHHDESIHAYYSWKVTQQGVGDYRYDPVYHGPVLYYSSAAVLWVAEMVAGGLTRLGFTGVGTGDSDFTGRLSAVLFGLGVMGFAWPLRRYLGRWGALSFLALLTFSPAWIYFARFVRHDVYLALANLAAVYFAFRYGETRKSWYMYLGGFFISLAACTKEDEYVLGAWFLVSFAGMLLWEVVAGRRTLGNVLAEVGTFFKTSLVPLLTGLVVFAIVWLALYTSFGTHPENWNPVKRALEYWIGQHNIKRIGAPWYYYFPQFFLYEPLIFFPTLVVLISPLFGKRPRHSLGAWLHIGAQAGFVLWLVLLIGSILGAAEVAPFRTLLAGLPPQKEALGVLLALSGGLAILRLAAVWVPDRFTRFIILWTYGSLGFYGWAQEKVPWLLVPQLLPLALVGGQWFGQMIERGELRRTGNRVALALVGLFTLSSLIQANFIWDAPKPEEAGARLNPPVRHAELLAYVQSTYDIHKIMDRIEEIARVTRTGTATRLAVGGDATWPFSWYLRHYPVNWAASVRKVDVPLLIVDKKPEVTKAVDEALGDRFEKVPFAIRGWWEANWSKATPANFLGFVFTRVAWSEVGSSDAVAYFCKHPEQPETCTGDVNPPPPPKDYTAPPTPVSASVSWGRLGTGRGEFNEPRGLHTDKAGNLYVVDSRNHRIQKLSPGGEVLATWGSQGADPGQFGKDPACGVAVGPDGSVYVTDTWNHRIQKFDSNGTFVTLRTEKDPPLWGPRGIAVAKDGTVFVTDTGNKRILAYTSNLELLRTWGKEGSGQGELIEPVGIAVNDAGQVIVADTGNHRLQFFQPDGTFVQEWPVFGWEEFYTEPNIAVSGEDVYVTDSYKHRFARYRNGKLTGTWGKSGTGAGEFNRPIGIAVGGPGTVYISDTMNHRVQRIEVGAATAP